MIRLRLIIFLYIGILTVGYAAPLDSLRIDTIKGQRFIIHKVDKNQTLNDIIKRYKTTIDEVVKFNKIEKNKVAKGDVIRIPYNPKVVNGQKQTTDSISVDQAHANAQSIETVKVYTHQVQGSETADNIAKKYNISLAQLSKWNNLKANKISIGQVLIVDEAATAKPYYRMNGPESQMPIVPQQAKLATDSIIEQQGIAYIDETALVLHPDAPIGTIIKVINIENNRQCLVRVTGQLDKSKYKSFIISIGKEAEEKLGASSVTLRVKIMYVVKS
ncbi:MAG: LysM peptidoglycan-binding domain-containing protein [Bacteroidia bacterium]|nr:LysM peptidoglycan-binding domain-containing protein [Bacteroidia bacterium]